MKQPSSLGLLTAVGVCAAAVASAVAGNFPLGSGLLVIASVTVIAALKVFEPADRPAKTLGVHPSFLWMVRACYVWLSTAAVLSIYAASADESGGIWGVSRHALTVGPA